MTCRDRRPGLAWLALAAALVLAACRTPATEVLVVVDTDARTRVLSMRVVASRGAAHSTHPEIRTWDRGADAALSFPASFAVVPGTGASDGTVTLEVSLQFAPSTPGQPAITVVRTARFPFTPRVPTYVRLFLPLSCTAEVAAPSRCADGRVPCSVSDYCALLAPAQTCGDLGSCVPVDLTTQPVGPDGGIPAFDVSAPALDAAADAMDARPPTDACVPACAGRMCGPDGCGGTCGACGAMAVCSTAGACVACVAGAACDPGDPCMAGAADCSGAAPVCHASGPRTAGTSCAGGVCDGAGACVACTDGAACTPASPCAVGVTRCATGRPVCTAAGNVPAGTGCPGGVCDGAGTCSACSAGAACGTGNPCTRGAVACGSGTPVCTTAGNVSAGTSCPGGVCDGAGRCSGCAAGATCVPPEGECTHGVIGCGTGMPVCAPTTRLAPGAACTGGVCNAAGACVACAAGAACATGSECTTGTVDCSGGAPACNATGNRPAGTGCTGGVCNGGGTCVACTPGAPCAPNDCSTGMITCTSGAAVCTPTGSRTAGTPCTGGVCSGGGACTPCVEGMGCAPPDECAAGGQIACASGTPRCSPTGARAEYTPCSGGFCRGGRCAACVPLTGCMASGPGVVCNNNVGIAPYSTVGSFGGFQSADGSSFQGTITVTFAIPVDSVTVRILDPDFAGNRMVAYNASGAVIGSVSFVGDNTPGSYTEDVESISAAGIARLELVPDDLDYVAYQSVQFTGCF